MPFDGAGQLNEICCNWCCSRRSTWRDSVGARDIYYRWASQCRV